ncbi:MAG: Glu-tRNA(Gln) amidotransferase subunit GatD [Candidatus Pacearchaeota archaeon]
MKKIKANPGDYVELSLIKRSYKGILLESPKSEKDIILIKLNTGYNIGFKKKDVLGIKILKRIDKKVEEIEVKKDTKKPDIAMILTGGTIASKYDPETGAVSPLTKSEELFKYYPEIFQIANVTKIEIPFMKASEDMDYKDWQKIAKSVERLINDPNIKGVIITHGTDTLHYTSAALSFFFQNLNKPVVLTYSQRSIDRASSDANLNLQCAALAAISDIAEVILVGHATIEDNFCYAMPGTKVRKFHSSRRDAFKVVNGKPIAKIYPNRIEIFSDYNIRSNRIVKADTRFEEKVALVKIYPGQDPDILDYYLKKKYRGVVLEVFGLGHVPTQDVRNRWINKIKEVQKKGMIVCAAAQTIYGRLNPMVYSNGRKLLEAGVIFLEDMLSETALIKLGYILGHKEWAKSKEIVKEKMLKNFVGEISDRLENLCN